MVLWDYHVIMIAKLEGHASTVYDLDTRLPFPCDFHQYFEEALKADDSFNECYQKYYRVISADEFLQSFASDRSHMKKPDGSWLKPPPSYSCITTPASPNNLDRFLIMDNEAFRVGKVLNSKELVEYFS